MWPGSEATRGLIGGWSGESELGMDDEGEKND